MDEGLTEELEYLGATGLSNGRSTKRMAAPMQPSFTALDTPERAALAANDMCTAAKRPTMLDADMLRPTSM